MSGQEAGGEVSRGAQWLDVRTEGSISGAALRFNLLPLPDIRSGAAKLDKAKTVHLLLRNRTLGRNGRFLLVQMGYRVVVLRGGLRSQ